MLVFGNFAIAEDGVAKDEILIGSTMDLSGPLTFMGQGWRDGGRAVTIFKVQNGIWNPYGDGKWITE